MPNHGSVRPVAKIPLRHALNRSAWWLVPAVYAVSAFAFVTDLQRDNTLAYGIIYTPLIVTAVYHKHRFGLWVLTAAACLMVGVGAFTPVVNPDLPDMIGNRVLSVLAILVTAAFVHHGRDVQERLSSETKRAEAAERIKSEVLTNLSQDIRTPLHSLVGMLALTMADSKPDQREVLGRISGDSRRLLATIDDLIDLLQIETRKLQRQTIDIAALVRQAGERVRIAARERRVFVVTGVDAGGQPTLAIGDPWATQRILDTLLANAVRSASPGGAVSVSVGYGTDRITASVRASGNGMPPGREGDSGEDGLHSGAQTLPEAGGIGLALSSHLARLMSGRVIVENEPGYSTTVTLSLPAA